MGPTALRLVAIVLSTAVLGGASCAKKGAVFSNGVLVYNGSESGDLVTVSASNGAIVLNGGAIPIQGGVPTLANTTRIVLRGRGGNDYLAVADPNGVLPPVQLSGDAGADVLVGDAGDDVVYGGPGVDVALLGGGDDTFVWNPGDELDTVEGQGGFDTLSFSGDDADDFVTVQSAQAGRVILYRNAGGVQIDVAGIEAIHYFARGGADDVSVSDTAGSGLARVRVDLASEQGGGDGKVDTVRVVGTQLADQLELAGNQQGIAVTGLSATVEVRGQDADDRLVIAALAGADVAYSEVAAGAIRTIFEGGLGDDLLIGGPGDEEFVGGDGNDAIEMGAGDDRVVWNPGDDSDDVDGDEGFDELLFNGANVGEKIDVSALGNRVRLFRDVASVTVEMLGVEAIDFPARGGTDMVVLRDTSGTDLVELSVDLAGTPGSAVGDGAADSVIVQGTPNDDHVWVYGDAGLVQVVGLATQLTLESADGPSDMLTIGTLAGDDVVQASGLRVPAALLTVDGGDDDDVLIGGDGPDVLLGGDGDDVLQGGPGLDVLDGGAGNNVVLP